MKYLLKFLVTSGIMRGSDGVLVLAKKLGAFLLGKTFKDDLRVTGISLRNRLGRHSASLRPSADSLAQSLRRFWVPHVDGRDHPGGPVSSPAMGTLFTARLSRMGP
jgi:hypothetical protein